MREGGLMQGEDSMDTWVLGAKVNRKGIPQLQPRFILGVGVGCGGGEEGCIS